MPESASHRDRSIDLSDDPRLQRLFWNIERVGWIVMVLLLLLSLLGVFGQLGIFSSAKAQSADGSLAVEYKRFLHHQSPSDLIFTLARPEGSESVELWMNTEYVHSIPVQRFHPRPTEVRSSSGRLLYLFETDPAQRIVIISAEMNATGIGNVPVQLGITGGASLSYSQFIYP